MGGENSFSNFIFKTVPTQTTKAPEANFEQTNQGTFEGIRKLLKNNGPFLNASENLKNDPKKKRIIFEILKMIRVFPTFPQPTAISSTYVRALREGLPDLHAGP